jgi:hypothetical protein
MTDFWPMQKLTSLSFPQLIDGWTVTISSSPDLKLLSLNVRLLYNQKEKLVRGSADRLPD